MSEENNNQEILKNITQEILGHLGYNAEVNVFSNEKDENLKVVAVNSSDNLSALIGKNGQTIRAIRKLLTVRAIAENVRVNLQLVEPQGELGTKTKEPEKTSE